MKNIFDGKFYIYLGMFFGCIFIISLFPYLFTSFCLVDLSGADGANIGNTMNGIMGPFVAMLAAFMTFIAFWMQYKTHVQQREDISQERYVNNFMKLMDIYRGIVSDIYLKDKFKGQSSFHFIFYEFKSIYAAVFARYGRLGDMVALYISFEIFMSGIVERGNPVLNTRIVDKLISKGYSLPVDFVYGLEVLEYGLIQSNDYFKTNKVPPFCFRVEKYERNTDFPDLYKGYMDKLSSYFNIAYLILVFLNSPDYVGQGDKILKEKMFSMQLSNHEVALIVMYIYYVRYRDDGETENVKKLDIAFLENLNRKFPHTFYWRDPDFVKSDN